MEEDYARLQKQLELLFADARDAAEYLRDHPDVSGEEKASCAYLLEFLVNHGYAISAPFGGMPHSFLAVPDARREEKGKKIALLCEYDALPGVGHACGHSLSCGCSLLAGMALQAACPELPFRVDLVGTPGEEFAGGKAVMVEHGVFEGYEFAAMIHMNNENQTHFEVLASNDRYITFHGKSSHASQAPEEGLNALNAARLFMDAMDMWRQHIPSDCQIHGIVEKGGTAPNIVPDEVCLNYYFRAGTLDHLKMLNEKARICAEGAAMATGTRCSLIQKAPTYGEIFCSGTMDRLVGEMFEKIGRTPVPVKKAGGSSDAGNVDMRIPVFHPMLDIAQHRKDILLHDKAFEALLHTEEADRGLRDGAAILANLIYKLAMEPELLEKIKEEHRRYRGL